MCIRDRLQQYAVALENPPLLIVCDLTQFRIHTNWTNTVQHVYEIALDDLHDANKRQWLKQAFADPDALKPGQTRQALTEAAAERFAGLAQELRHQGHAPHLSLIHIFLSSICTSFCRDKKPSVLLTTDLETPNNCPSCSWDSLNSSRSRCIAIALSLIHI